MSTTKHTFNVCSTIQRRCANKNCNCTLYIGKASKGRTEMNARKSHSISPKLQYLIFQQHQVVFEEHHRMCDNCCNVEKVSEMMFEYDEKCEIVPSYIFTILNQLSKENNGYFNERTNKPYLHHSFVEKEHYLIMTGLTYDEMNSLEYKCNNHTTEKILLNFQYLLMVLTLIYHKLSFAFLGMLFGYGKSSVSRIIGRVINILSFYYVPTQLGSNIWSHKKILQNRPKYCDILFPNKNVIAISDGGYLQIQQSGCFMIYTNVKINLNDI
jgi:hypothetical protein